MRNNKVLFLTSLLAITCLVACGSNTHKSSLPETSSSEPASSETSISSEVSSSSEASSSEESSSSSSSSSSNPGPTPITLPEADETKEFDNTVPYYPKEILINHRLASILVNEEYQLAPIGQYKYDGSTLQYVSKDPSIVTVDETGLLKGIKAGKTEVEVSDKNNPELKTVVPVTVNAECDEDDAAKISAALAAVDESGLNQLVDNEMY